MYPHLAIEAIAELEQKQRLAFAERHRRVSKEACSPRPAAFATLLRPAGALIRRCLASAWLPRRLTWSR